MQNKIGQDEGFFLFFSFSRPETVTKTFHYLSRNLSWRCKPPCSHHEPKSTYHTPSLPSLTRPFKGVKGWASSAFHQSPSEKKKIKEPRWIAPDGIIYPPKQGKGKRIKIKSKNKTKLPTGFIIHRRSLFPTFC
ncbi:hypothetical protein I7I53_01994 [Histoplasma capsulatum var. duboisii H88]|uniref:Uncharacterized protein n=1 Tax=Ajellomyces capsulatus (strain H88) TaxID=544711 RepID=A0A8A1LJB7_AJEC8|nr:hypothetical protein I7I53_01994 [Histoplasma capsulatum var. duboisii H88]